MKKILILGAGLSASSLIKYLLDHSEENNWQVRVNDRNISLAEAKINGHKNGVALSFNAISKEERLPELKNADLIISMLPARFHPEVAADCIAEKKSLITPSYVSPEMKALDAEARKAGILIMNEMGVDPGIDHMSAMKIIDEIKEKGGTITSFKSYCGGLVAPESDNNPWNYKFTWNPRNVILAGSGGSAQYIDRGQYKFIPYSQVFQRLDSIAIEGFGDFEGYANRDSLSYRAVYGLDEIPTIYRGTLRRTGYCANWNVFVQLGMTDDSYAMPHSEDLSMRDFTNAFLKYNIDVSVEDKFSAFAANYGITDISAFEWLGLFDGTRKIGLKDASPAQLLEAILKEKLELEEGDKDMVVMIHQFIYTLNGKEHFIESSMGNIGHDDVYTSMSNTVGLPIAICAKMILQDKISLTGVRLPIMKEVYEPVLEELKELGISFNETYS